MKPKKRFIAGAVCPRCGEMDRIVVYQEAGDQFRACVACDFVEKQERQESAVNAPVIPTRVSAGAYERTDEDKGSGVRIIAVEVRQ